MSNAAEANRTAGEPVEERHLAGTGRTRRRDNGMGSANQSVRNKSDLRIERVDDSNS